MASEEAAAHGSSSTADMIMSRMLPSRRVLVPHRSPFSADRRHLFTTRTSNQILDPWISKLVPRWVRGARGSSEHWNFPPKGRSQCQGAAGSDRILRGHGIPTLADGDQARAVIPGDLHVSSTGHQNLLWKGSRLPDRLVEAWSLASQTEPVPPGYGECPLASTLCRQRHVVDVALPSSSHLAFVLAQLRCAWLGMFGRRSQPSPSAVVLRGWCESSVSAPVFGSSG